MFGVGCDEYFYECFGDGVGYCFCVVDVECVGVFFVLFYIEVGVYCFLYFYYCYFCDDYGLCYIGY